jgi:hypothetical protein
MNSQTIVSEATEPATTAQAPAYRLKDSERQPCEVWTRVMGYHRPVSSFNIGKKGEHQERKFFLEARCSEH